MTARLDSVEPAVRDPIRIDFEGWSIEARAGETVAATLTAHGIRGLRATRTGADRGVFCGMGVCQDCLVEVDGVPNQRACMTSIDRPLRVRRQRHGQALAAEVTALPPATAESLRTERPDVLVIGAGPGGLSAAIAARRAGAAVVVVDERRYPGGQYFKPLAVDGEDVAPPDAQHREGLALVRRALEAGVEIRTGVMVWGAFAPAEFTASDDRGAVRYLPKAAIVATGAYERGWPVPGWQLPGVMTTGAAQTLWRTARRLPGRRVLIAGNGPLNLQLAAELLAGGAEVAAVVESARPGARHLGALVAMAAAAPSLVRDGIRYHWQRMTRGVPMIDGMVVAAIERTAEGLAVTLKNASENGGHRRFEVDALCIGYGFEPSNELLRALGCRHDFDAEQNRLVTRRDGDGRTSVAGVYALGDCTAMGGARVAAADGAVAGYAAAAELGLPLAPALEREREAAKKQGDRHRRFQRALWTLYRAPPYRIEQASDDTIICRCEEVCFGDARAALAEGVIAAGPLKRATRIGMGPCQGRYCRPLLEALLAQGSDRQPDEHSGFAPRVPVKPIAIRDLASASD
ncbi:FAD-dependent oxidoreductase [Sphingoaurantiacus capsulatus]|uniref:FAD-dependent oxidoreductase n=1 Tax=Sphingoaurantiacus capsulatus TaxID=1771310 RepID=A0ABV7XCE2_9SPHN